MRANALPRQLLKFGVVGAANTLLSFFAFRVLVDIHLAAPLASGLAFAVGAVNGYWWNHRWTFGTTDALRARVRYLVVQFGALAMSSALVWLLVRSELAATAAYLAAMATVSGVTFVANRHWTFTSSTSDDSSAGTAEGAPALSASD